MKTVFEYRDYTITITFDGKYWVYSFVYYDCNDMINCNNTFITINEAKQDARKYIDTIR